MQETCKITTARNLQGFYLERSLVQEKCTSCKKRARTCKYFFHGLLVRQVFFLQGTWPSVMTHILLAHIVAYRCCRQLTYWRAHVTCQLAALCPTGWLGGRPAGCVANWKAMWPTGMMCGLLGGCWPTKRLCHLLGAVQKAGRLCSLVKGYWQAPSPIEGQRGQLGRRITYYQGHGLLAEHMGCWHSLWPMEGHSTYSQGKWQNASPIVGTWLIAVGMQPTCIVGR